jgi:hypothetical protein
MSEGQGEVKYNRIYVLIFRGVTWVQSALQLLTEHGAMQLRFAQIHTVIA